MTCQHPTCAAELTWRGTGRKPRFCTEHRGSKYSTRRQRERDAQPQALRPPCCCDAGRVGGRQSCPQHKDEGLGTVGKGAPAADYAGMFPRVTRKPAERKPPLRPGTWRPADKGSDVKMLLRQPITEVYEFDPKLQGSRIPVIGQTDLTWDGKPSAHVDAKPMRGLITRGPDWPWADNNDKEMAA